VSEKRKVHLNNVSMLRLIYEGQSDRHKLNNFQEDRRKLFGNNFGWLWSKLYSIQFTSGLDRRDFQAARPLMSYSLCLSLNDMEFNIRKTPTQVLRVMQDETNA
jgi:hypothetical protein